MSNDKPSEKAWEIAAKKKLRFDRLRYNLTSDGSVWVELVKWRKIIGIAVSYEEALAAQAELDADEVTDAENAAAHAEYCKALSEQGVTSFELVDRIILAAKKARRNNVIE